MIKNNKDNNEEIDLKDFLYLIIRNKFIIFCLASISFVGSALYSLSLKRIWAGDFQIVIRKENNPADQIKTNAFAELLSNSNSNNLQTEIEILKSPSVLMPIFKYVKGAYEENGIKSDDLTYKKWLSQNLRIGLADNTEVLNVGYRDKNKDLILPVLNKISFTYKQYSGKNKRRSQELTNNFFKDQLSLFKKKSSNSLRVAQEYAIDKDLIFYDIGKENNININGNTKEFPENSTLQSTNLLSPNIGIEKARVSAANQIRKINLQLQKIQELEDSEELQYIGSTIPALRSEGLPKTLSDIEESLAKARSHYTDKDIAITNLIKRRNLAINLLKSRTIKYLEAQKLDAEAAMKATMRPKGVLLKYKELIREASRDEKTLIQLEDRYNLFKLELASQEDPWELITKPTINNYPVAPSRKKITIFGTFGGILTTILLILIFENSKGILYTKKDLERLIGYPIIKFFEEKEINNWQSKIELLYESNIFSKNNNYLILQMGIIDEFLIENLRSLTDKVFKDIKLNYSSNIKEALNSKNIILLVQLGKLTNQDVKKMEDDLSFQDKNIKGIFYFK